jgi:hypothetical protein
VFITLVVIPAPDDAVKLPPPVVTDPATLIPPDASVVVVGVNDPVFMAPVGRKVTDDDDGCAFIIVTLPPRKVIPERLPVVLI